MSGLYLHIPFCRKRCTYCDFHFSTTFENYRSSLIRALVQELVLRSTKFNGSIQTIYFGGGTPSILNESELSLIFDTIRQHYIVAPDAEISFEANPEDITVENLTTWKSVGINRLSIGLQTFSDADLQWMNRAHLVSDGLDATPTVVHLRVVLVAPLDDVAKGSEDCFVTSKPRCISDCERIVVSTTEHLLIPSVLHGWRRGIGNTVV